MSWFGGNQDSQRLDKLTLDLKILHTAMLQMVTSQLELIRSVQSLKEQVKMSHEEIVARLQAAVAANDENVDRLITIAEENAAKLKEIADNATDFVSLKEAVLAQADKLDEQNAQTRAALDNISPPPAPPTDPPTDPAPE